MRFNQSHNGPRFSNPQFKTITNDHGPSSQNRRHSHEEMLSNRANFPSLPALAHLSPSFRCVSEIHPLEVLVIEENPVQMELLCSYLLGLGYFPKVADTLTSARRQILQRNHDVFFLDVDNTKVDAFALLPVLTERAAGGKQPMTVAMSSSPDPAIRLRCMREGLTHFRCKPIDLMGIMNLLLSACPAQHWPSPLSLESSGDVKPPRAASSPTSAASSYPSSKTPTARFSLDWVP